MGVSSPNNEPLIPGVSDADDSNNLLERFGGSNRVILIALLAVLGLAALIALWSLLTGGDETANEPAPLPTAVTLPTSETAPTVGIVSGSTGTEVEPTATVDVIEVTPTALPVGFSACSIDQAPSATASYIVDTNSVPLKHRSGPSIDSEQVGSSPSASTGLVPDGDCVFNENEQRVWWAVDVEGEQVWVAAAFLTPR